MEDFATRIASLTPEKRTLLERTLKQKNLVLPAQQLIPRRANHGPVPLSFAQQRLWFLSNLEPSSTAYNQPKAVRLSGDLNIGALNRAFNALVRRHEILRTTVHSSDGALPIQMVGEPNPLDLQLVDLSGLANSSKQAELKKRLAEITDRPFDLARDLMLRAALLKLGSDEHVLVLVTHHIATDGWSSGILWHELTTLYRAYLKGETSPLPELPIQYADFAVWQRNWLQGEVLQNHIAYWRNELNGISTLQLPTDRPRPAVQSYRGASQSLLLPKALAIQLHGLSRQEGVTLFMTLLAAFQTLLYRYCGQDDIAVGSPTAGRARSETEGLIGFFVNTLVLRSDLSGNPSFRQLLDRVRKTSLAAYEHQDLPFEKLVEEFHPARDLSRSPLFQVMFAHQNQPWRSLEFSGLVMTPLEIKNDTAKFDLSLDTWEEPAGLKAILEYKTDLFDAATATRILSHFQTLLEGIVANPNLHISDLEILTSAERQQLLVDWNDTNKDYPKDKCIHEVFEEQVEKSPDAVALLFDDQTLTYRNLNTKANQLGHYLRELGVGPGILVGLCMERSLEMVVGMLGILKAGGAYLPIDPDCPQERLSYILESAKAPVLITRDCVIQSSHLPNTKVVCLASDWADIARNSDKNLAPLSRQNDLFYTIYTSGSTGQPKGACVYQRGFLNLVHWFKTEFSITANERVLLLSSPSFDLTQKNIYATLISGGELHLLPGVQHDPEQIVRMIAEHKITLINCTPSAFYPLVERGVATSEMLKYLRIVFLGGESISIPRLRPWLERNPHHWEIVNTYGPTECTDICAFYRMNRQNLDEYPFVPIGRPIFNVQLVVLDQKLRLCPPGIAGELCVTGAGVGAGYINDPDLTAAKFIPNPFTELAGDRIYKTGDRVRTLPDGNIEYLERMDHQVKLRGFRIELGEIEAVLGQHPKVREAVVMTRENVPGEKRLVAYVVSSTETAPTASELRGFLQERLPDYMIPAAIVMLKALPLTPTGKVDRTALPAPDQTSGNLEKGFVAPRDRFEHQLTKIWEKLLEVKPIGIRDNFFHLGGHSLLAMSMIARIEKKLAKHLPLAAIFQAPTIEELASLLRQKGRSESWSSLLAIQPKGPKLPFFCVQGSADLAYHLGPDQPFYALQPSPLEGKRFSSSKVEDIAADFVKEIRTLQPEGPYLLGGFSFGGKVAFEMAHQMRKQGHEVRLLALLDPGIIDRSKRSTPVSAIRSSLTERITLRWAELHRRLRKLAVLEPQQKLNFLWNAARWRVEGRIRRIEREIKKFACWIYLAMGLRLPPGLRSLYFVEVSSRAVRKYVPQVYPGRLIVFPTEEISNETRLEWGRLAGGGIEFHVVPGNHSNVMSESIVQLWGEQLRVCIDAAQTAE